MQIKQIATVILLSLNLFAQERICEVDDRIMYGIASVEKHVKTPVGYPFLISLNLKKDQEIAQKDKELSSFFLDRRTIDCRDEDTCVTIFDKLISKGIINIDCGGFQINYKYWKMQKNNYFNIQKSYNKACSIVMAHNKNEWTWENIAKYHSKTKKYNDKYKNILLSIVEKNI